MVTVVIQKNIREKLLNYLLYLTSKGNKHIQVFFGSVWIMDSFLSIQKNIKGITDYDFKCLLGVAFLMSCKYWNYDGDDGEFVERTINIPLEKILALEKKVWRGLDFSLNYTSPIFFLDQQEESDKTISDHVTEFFLCISMFSEQCYTISSQELYEIAQATTKFILSGRKDPENSSNSSISYLLHLYKERMALGMGKCALQKHFSRKNFFDIPSFICNKLQNE